MVEQNLVPTPQTTLLILLGASAWPAYPGLNGSPAFARSAERVRHYFGETYGLAAENVLDLFDLPLSNFEIGERIGTFLAERSTSLKAAGQEVRDLLFYYIGHGLLADARGQAYYLALRTMRKDEIRGTAFSVEYLAELLKKYTKRVRRIIILDSCFSGAAANLLQSEGAAQVANRQAVDAFSEGGRGRGYPRRGTSLLCSSSPRLASYLCVDQRGTMFSEALVRALEQGNEFVATERLSLEHLRDTIEEVQGQLVEELNRNTLMQQEQPPRPVIYSTDQSEGDVARVGFFPNVAELHKTLQEQGQEEQQQRAQVQVLEYQKAVEKPKQAAARDVAGDAIGAAIGEGTLASFAQKAGVELLRWAGLTTWGGGVFVGAVLLVLGLIGLIPPVHSYFSAIGIDVFAGWFPAWLWWVLGIVGGLAGALLSLLVCIEVDFEAYRLRNVAGRVGLVVLAGVGILLVCDCLVMVVVALVLGVLLGLLELIPSVADSLASVGVNLFAVKIPTWLLSVVVVAGIVLGTIWGSNYIEDVMDEVLDI